MQIDIDSIAQGIDRTVIRDHRLGGFRFFAEERLLLRLGGLSLLLLMLDACFLQSVGTTLLNVAKIELLDIRCSSFSVFSSDLVKLVLLLRRIRRPLAGP